MSSSTKDLRQQSAGDQSQGSLIQAHQEEKQPSKPRLASSQQIEQLRLLYEIRLYCLQRVGCFGLALWVFLQTADLTKFLVILAAGFMNIQWATKILAGAITGAIGATRTKTSED